MDNAGDSVLQIQLRIAELSGNSNLLFIALFGDAITNISNWRSIQTFEKAILFIKKGIDYSKAIGREDYLTLAYVRLAALYRKRGQIDNAYYNANIAFTSSLNIESDSIKIIASIELGDAYQLKRESLLAYKTYISAFDKSIAIDNATLQSEVYHRYAGLYRSLDNQQQAKEYLLQSMELNEHNHNAEGLIKDYIALARFTSEKQYIEKAIELAQSLSNEKYIIESKKLMIGYYAYAIANSDSTLKYLSENSDVNQVYVFGDESKYFWTLGEVYLYSANKDSALKYLKLAEKGFEKNYEEYTRQVLYEELGLCYSQLNEDDSAIIYYQKAVALTNQLKDPVKIARYSFSLSELYEKTGDYKNALLFSRAGATLKDSLEKLANQKDIALIEVNNEKKNHERNLEKIEKRNLVKRNLQYMAITVVITFLFLFLIVTGMFAVSKLTIKILGYFTFICLFEFIVLLIDSFLHRIAHGEPLKIWLMKIILIAILVPFQHYLEHGLIKFIESKKLHRIREKFTIKKWWKSRKKPTVSTIDDMENDTAVL